MLAIGEWLEATWIATWVRESLYGFAIVVAVHILGLTVSVGTLVWFDLRLLGICLVRIPATQLYRRLMPWMLSGFASMFVSGGILFVSYATAASGNFYFRIKVAAFALAGVNALVYHNLTERHVARWNEARCPPLAARLAGFVSIVLWTTVILAGRMMSYTMF